jgi:hypothetical protein
MSLKISPIHPETGAVPRRGGSLFRKVAFLLILIIAVLAIYTIYDFNRAKGIAAAICKSALPGMPLEGLLSAVSEKDFKIIRSSDHVIIVPKNGMGRNHCTVSHDGRIIRGSKQGFSD